MPTLVELLCLTIMRYWTDETKHVIGNLVLLVRVGDHGCQENKRTVAYDDPKKESVKCFFQAHNKIGQNSFKVSMARVFEFPFTDILTHVNLAVSDSGSTSLSLKRSTRKSSKA